MTRSFERMLKDAPGRKYTALQTALKAYLGLFSYWACCFLFLFRSALVQFPIQVKTAAKPCCLLCFCFFWGVTGSWDLRVSVTCIAPILVAMCNILGGG